MTEVEKFVEHLFTGVVDKAGAPYYLHCKYVAELAKETAGAYGLDDQTLTDVYNAGLCHDVLEDTQTSRDTLVDLIGERATVAVELCSHPNGNFDYDKYIKGILSNTIASLVKYADSTHNSQISRFGDISHHTERRKMKCARYAKRAELIKSNLDKTLN